MVLFRTNLYYGKPTDMECRPYCTRKVPRYVVFGLTVCDSM